MAKLFIWSMFILSSLIIFILLKLWFFNDINDPVILYIILGIDLVIWLVFIYLWYRIYKLWNIKLKLDNINYKFWDDIKYDISVLIKENIPEPRNLYIQIIWVRKIRRWDSTHYDRTMIKSEKIDTLWNNFSEIKKNYAWTIKIPTLDELMWNSKDDLNSWLKQSYQEYIKDNPELAWKITEQDYLAGSNMVINTIASFVWTDLSKPNYDFYEVKVILDDERWWLLETDLEKTKKIYVS